MKGPKRAPRLNQDRKRAYACGPGGFRAKYPKIQLRCFGCGVYYLGANARADLETHQAVPA